jgi:predicted nucleic acid-binding protein
LKVEKRYWDSSVIAAYLNNEHGRASVCQSILDEAEQGKILIYTSALTIAEVLKLKHVKPISKENRAKVFEFFQNNYIKIIQVTRWIAYDAQELVWEKGIPPKDAIHVASALKQKLEIMESYDYDDLIKKSETVGSPPLEIREPRHLQPSLQLVLPRKKDDESDKTESQEAEQE